MNCTEVSETHDLRRGCRTRFSEACGEGPGDTSNRRRDRAYGHSDVPGYGSDVSGHRGIRSGVPETCRTECPSCRRRIEGSSPDRGHGHLVARTARVAALNTRRHTREGETCHSASRAALKRHMRRVPSVDREKQDRWIGPKPVRCRR